MHGRSTNIIPYSYLPYLTCKRVSTQIYLSQAVRARHGMFIKVLLSSRLGAPFGLAQSAKARASRSHPLGCQSPIGAVARPPDHLSQTTRPGEANRVNRNLSRLGPHVSIERTSKGTGQRYSAVQRSTTTAHTTSRRLASNFRLPAHPGSATATASRAAQEPTAALFQEQTASA